MAFPRRLRRALAVLIGAACALAAASAAASAITTVEYRAGITQGADTAHGGALAAIAAGPDGNLWFTEQPGRIGRITPAGHATELTGFPVGLLAIAAGPDGRMWFTEQPPLAAPRLGWIAVDGSARGSYPIAAGEGPILTSLVAGPDGALWFTSFEGAATLGRMTTTGAVTRFTPAYTPPSEPAQIAVGPGGALWYTESGEGFGDGHSAQPTFQGIGRIAVDGTITAFPLRSRGVFPLDIASGPGGALWFTDHRQVGRLTTAGRYTLYDARAPLGRYVGAIVTGPDGNVWYAIGGGRIGRMTPSGLTTIFRTPSRDPAPGDLAVGADGNLWMTDETGGVVKVVPPRGRCVVPALVGLRFARAAQRLHRSRCTIGRVASPRSTRRGGLFVLHQFPRRSVRLPAEGAVDLMLSR